MATSFTTAIADPLSGRSTAIVIDHHDYAQSVILQGRDVPWHDPTAYSNFFGQAQGLLKPDVALLTLDRFYDEEQASNNVLQDAMSARQRTGYALRALLADSATVTRAVDLVTTLAHIVREPLVVQIPSPMQWLSRTHQLAGTEGADELDLDAAENASMYVADWLRGLAAVPLAGILLDDRPIPGAAPLPSVGLDTYTPITNVARHYRWDVAIRTADRVLVHNSEPDRKELGGSAISPEFWRGDGTTLPPTDFYITQLPADAVPELVLAQLATLA